MKKEELLEAAKLRTRKTSVDALDADVQQLVNVALEDLRRIGVHETWLENPEDPLIIEAVLNYVKANYGINNQYTILIGCYNMTLTKIKGRSKYRKEAPEHDGVEESENVDETVAEDIL